VHRNPLRYYLVFMLIGIFLGGLISALFANRVNFKLERGGKASQDFAPHLL